MTTITIPKKLTQRGELIVIPRKEYESLIEIAEKKMIDADILESLKDYKEGRYYGPFSSIEEGKKALKHKK